MAGIKYTKEEVQRGINKGLMLTDVMNTRQREYLLGVLMAKFICDGEMDVLTELVKRTVKAVR